MSCGNKVKDAKGYEGEETKNNPGGLRGDETDTCFCVGLDLLWFLFSVSKLSKRKFAKIQPLTFSYLSA
jgi:hypothetical protein